MTDPRCNAPGCENVITRQSKTGRCHACAVRAMHADPAYQKRRLEGLRKRNAEPGERERRIGWLRAGRENMSDEKKAARSAHGYRLVRDYLSQPEIRARSQSPEARARAAAACSDTVMAWCPEELRPHYRDLVRSKRIPAAEARRLIEAEIPGTVEHAQREIANRELAMRLRDEKRRAAEY